MRNYPDEETGEEDGDVGDDDGAKWSYCRLAVLGTRMMAILMTVVVVLIMVMATTKLKMTITTARVLTIAKIFHWLCHDRCYTVVLGGRDSLLRCWTEPPV